MAGEWRDMRWGDLATLQYGRALRGHDTGTGPFRVFGTNGPIGWHTEALCSHPSVIIGRKGAYRGVHYSPAPFFVIDTAFYLEPKTDIDLRWAYYALLTHDINAMDSGSAIPSTSRDAFYGLPVRVPPLPEQRAIAHILGTLDDKIDLNRRMSQTLEAMARALFKSWFVDFEPVRAKVESRDPGLPKAIADVFPDRFQDSELGEIPKGWSVGALGELLTAIETGGRPKGGVKDVATGVPSVGAESIVGLGHFDYSKTKFVPVEFFLAMTKGHVRDGDVLLYKDGGRPGEFEPHVTMVGDRFPFEAFCINEHVYRLRTEPRVPQEYLYFWLSSDGAMDEMRNRGTGVAIPGLNSSAVRQLAVLLPGEPALTQFHAEVGKLVQRVFANCNQSRALATLRDTLLPKLICGEVRVTDAKRFLGTAV
jgi:type I restriction enzyme, S subunit